jgi:hypothetical protein
VAEHLINCALQDFQSQRWTIIRRTKGDLDFALIFNKRQTLGRIGFEALNEPFCEVQTLPCVAQTTQPAG